MRHLHYISKTVAGAARVLYQRVSKSDPDFKSARMSLIPRDYNHPFYGPGALAHWGWDDEDLWWPWSRDFRSLLRFPEHIQTDVLGGVKEDKDKYEVSVDVQQFAPEEIAVKTFGDNTIVVEGKHEERPDQHGYIARHFVRRYELPEGHNANEAVSNLSSDGVLTITVPKIGEKAIESKERIIPITHKKEGWLSRLKHKLLG